VNSERTDRAPARIRSSAPSASNFTTSSEESPAALPTNQAKWYVRKSAGLVQISHRRKGSPTGSLGERIAQIPVIRHHPNSDVFRVRHLNEPGSA